MPLVATRGAASAQGFGEFAQAAAPVYIEDVFSTYLYTGNGSSQTITNGIDLSTNGGLVWLKSRSNVSDHQLVDTARGRFSGISSNTVSSQDGNGLGGGSFLTNGFSVGFIFSPSINTNNETYASWTFRKQPKFFDIVTYTGNGASNRNISHNLGSSPYCIIVKRLDSSSNWMVAHYEAELSQGGNPVSEYLNLNNTNAANYTGTTNAGPWAFGSSSTLFSVFGGANINGATYVAYLFAHNAGGFGLTGSDNVISCGSFTTSGTGTATVNLGYEPQFLLYKQSSTTGNWRIVDTMRGWNFTDNDNVLFPDLSAAEVVGTAAGNPTATGFFINGANNSTTYIYIAIRRGPMKTPTTGTQVFYGGSIPAAGSVTWTSNILTDFVIPCELTGASYNFYSNDRLRGGRYLQTSSTSSEQIASVAFDVQNGLRTTSSWYTNGNFAWFFRRFPGVFDVVCYTGNGGGIFTYVNHNLGVKPEFMIIKNRSNGGTVNQSWWVSHKDIFYNGILNSTDAFNTYAYNGNVENSTSTQIAVSFVGTNASGENFVAYLFATVAGVSKVGSYTGTGALQTVNCGFTTGARFIMIKRTDAVGDWWIYDSSRGISSGNDPYIYWNNAAAGQVTNTNYVDTTSVGFQVTAAAPAGLNANGGTYIFLAIA